MSDDFDWEGRYREDTAGWDFGEVVPALEDWLVDQPPVTGKVVVPGCGRGHEAAAVADKWPEAVVVGVDLSETAVREAQEGYIFPNLRYDTGDFFAASGKDDLVAIIEHTCFCAIPPELRPVYRDTAARRLRAGGLLIAVFYLHPEETEGDPDDGPPWGCSVPELNGLFDELFETLVSQVPARAFEGRKNRELFRVLRRR